MEKIAPTGTVTFLFTDIEGSTRLWDRHPDAMSGAMRTHDQVLDAVVDEHHGYVFSRAGDGWGISFTSPTLAIDAALGIQEMMVGTDWPDPIEVVKVRMGLHTGTATERNGDYFGTAVNRAARVAAAAAGEQIFITDTVRTLVADDDRDSWRLRDLGEHRLKDLVRTERIWQVDWADAPATVTTIGDRLTAGNLPPQRTAVLGRDDTVVDIAEMLDANQLVTLVGVGGVGKTTLAQAAGRAIRDRYPNGIWFVDLSGVASSELIDAATASALNVSLRPEMSILESLYDALRSEKRLIILDNAENQIDAVADLVDGLLTNVPDIHVIVTSRESLAIQGEKIVRVDPLAVDGAHSPAVTLFMERAARVAPDLDAEALDAGIVEQVVRRLDGLPLAIELAASQCELMTPQELLAAIESDDVSLESASRSTAQRHRSLDAMIHWSYDKLDPADKLVFDRLSVFRGGGTNDAAIAVCSDDSLSSAQVTSSLRTLVRKSLVIPERLEGVTRTRQLEPLRMFAANRLDNRGETEDISRRHAGWYGQQTENASKGLEGPDEARYLRELLAELDNVRAALSWSGDHQDWGIMARIGSAIPYLVESKMRPEMKVWILDALAVLPQDDIGRVSYGFAAGLATIYVGALNEAPNVFADATRNVPDRSLVAFYHSYLDLVRALFQGDTDTIISDTPEAIEAARRLTTERWTAALAVDLALAFHYRGDTSSAAAAMNEVLEYADRSANPTVLAWARYIEGEILAASDPAAAIEILEEGVEYGLTVDNDFLAGISLVALASTAGRSGETAVALNGMQRCIRLWRTAGNRPQMWTAMRNLVEILHTIGMNEDAYILHNATEADAEHAAELFGPFGDKYRTIVAAISSELGSEASAQAATDGSSLDYAAAATHAITAIDRAAARIDQPAQ